MIRALRRKFTLITMLLVTLVLLGVFVGIVLYYSGMLRQEGYRTLEMMLDRPPGDREPHFQVGGNAPDGFRREPGFVVSVDDSGLPTLTTSDYIEVSEEDLQQITAAVLESGAKRGELHSYDLRFMVKQKGNHTEIAFATLSFEKSQLQNVVLVTGLAALGAFLVFLAASVLLARWALKPVERSWQRQRRFVADASHELKTPLTVILANTGILKAHPQNTISEQLPWVENTEQETQRMKGLVDNLLFLAKSDDAAADIPLAAVNLSDVVATTALSFEAVAFEQGFAIDMEVPPDITVQGNEPQLRQLVGILLDNALKYGRKKSTVGLWMVKRPNQVEFAVRNMGEPIGAEQQKHLFDRFYRADPARAEAGYGLGLSIAQSIVANHNGKITVDSNAEATTFTVYLPVS